MRPFPLSGRVRLGRQHDRLFNVLPTGPLRRAGDRSGFRWWRGQGASVRVPAGYPTCGATRTRSACVPSTLQRPSTYRIAHGSPLEGQHASRWLHLPLKRGVTGGLRPPFLVLRTPMRNIGFGGRRRVGIMSRTVQLTPTRLAALGDPLSGEVGQVALPRTQDANANATAP